MNMKIIDKKIEDILNSEEINSKFISAKHNQLNIQCNILKENFFLDKFFKSNQIIEKIGFFS